MSTLETGTASGSAVEIKKIKFGEKLGFCAFSGSNNIVYQFKSLYYLFFLTNVLKINVFWAGTIFTIGIIWDAVNDPLIGYFAVNRRFKNGERVRPFALWHSIPWAAMMVLLFTNFGAGQVRFDHRLARRLHPVRGVQHLRWDSVQQHGRARHRQRSRQAVHQRFPQSRRLPRLGHRRHRLQCRS